MKSTYISKTKLFSQAAFALTCSLLFFIGCSGDTTNISYDLASTQLTDLSVDGFDISFSSEKTGVYTIEIPNKQSSITVNFIPKNESHEFSFSNQNIAGTQSIELNDDRNFTTTLEEGNNLVSINIYNPTDDIYTSYTLNAYRLSSAARLSNLSLYDFTTDSAITLTPSFIESTFDYSANVAYSTCSYAYQFNLKNSGASASARRGGDTLGDLYDTVTENQIHYRSLLPGDNTLDISVTSEDYSSSNRYSVKLTRQPPTDSQIKSNANLSSIHTQLDHFDYICGKQHYTFYIDNNIDTIQYTLTPEVDGATIWLNGNEIDPEETQSITAEADAGTSYVTVVAANGTTTQEYSLSYIRRSYNAVNVETTEELIHALSNAQPNDQIRISSGRYVLDETTSGMLSSDRSGTALQPIRIIGEKSLTQSVIITSDTTNNDNALLTLTGDYWHVSNISFEGTQPAIHLKGSTGSVLDNLEFSHFQNNALILSNGANGNTVARSSFSSPSAGTFSTTVQAAAIYVGDAQLRNSPPHEIMGTDEASDSNTIQHNSFTNLENIPAIGIDAGAINTRVSHNRFLESTQPMAAGTRTSILLSIGENTHIHENYFEYTDAHTIASIIQGGDHSLAPLWGGQLKLIQNTFNLNKNSLASIKNNSSFTVYLAENSRIDQELFALEGGNFDSDTFSAPVYTIQTTGNNTRCLGIEEYDIAGTQVWFVELEDCLPNDISQQWKTEVDGGIYVGLINQSQEYGHMRTATEFEELCSASEGTYQSNVYLTEDNGGYVERWMLDTRAGITTIRNKKDPDYGLTIPGATVNTGTPLMTCALIGTEAQQFSLVPVTR